MDRFEAASRQVPRAALRPIFAHLPDDATVRFQAVEEEWLPLGLDHARQQAELNGLEDALTFLAASGGALLSALCDHCCQRCPRALDNPMTRGQRWQQWSLRISPPHARRPMVNWPHGDDAAAAAAREIKPAPSA